MSFQIVSDLHIEHKNSEIPDPLDYITPTAEILILAGDIGSLYKRYQLEGFLRLLCPLFKIVIYVPGNHEYYTNSFMDKLTFYQLNDILNDIEKNIANMYVLNRKSIIINNILLAGCTLWSNPTINIPKFIVKIHEMNTSFYKDLHVRDLKYIENIISYSKKNNLKLLLVTHHCPTFSVVPKRKNEKYKSLYATDLEYLLVKSNINTWICGHVHSNFDFITKGGTRLIGNQKGKCHEKVENYSKTFTINL
jgi:predicted phosphohydrolase